MTQSQVRKFVILYFATALSLDICFRVAQRNVTGYTKAYVMRLHSVVTFETIMVLLSIFIWKRMLSLFDSGSKQQLLPSTRRLSSASERSQSSQMVKLRLTTMLLTAVCILASHLSYFLYYFQPSNEDSIYASFCFATTICLAVYSHLVFFLVGFSIVNFLTRALITKDICQKFSSSLLNLPFLRTLLINSQFQSFLSLLLTAFFVTFGLYVATSSPTVKKVTIPLARLPSEFHGFRIVLLTDLHIGMTVSRRNIVDMVDTINSLNADVVVISGDLVDGSLEQVKYAVEPLIYLKSKKGLYFSTGNHDYYYGNVDQLLQFLSGLGFNILHNNSTELLASSSFTQKHSKGVPERSLCIAGADDISADNYEIPHHSCNISAALSNCLDTSVRILVAHNPLVAKKVVSDKLNVDLILSGHNHGGQLYVTAPIVYLMSPYFAGLYEPVQSTSVYVSTGVFYFMYPVKIAGFMEITDIVLSQKS